MGVVDESAQGSRWPERRLSRRGILRYSFLSGAALSILAACQSAATPAPTTAPAAPQPTTPPAAAPTTAPAAAATTAPAKPTSAPAAAATTAPAAASNPNAAFSGPPADAALNLPKVSISGKLTVVQARDFHPDHNAYIEAQIKAFAQKMGYDLDHSYIEAYAGSGDVVQKLTAAVQAGDAPDLLIHTLGASQLHFLDIVEDVSDFEATIEKQQGKLAPAFDRSFKLDGKYWGIPHFSRSGGFWARPSVFKAANIDPLKDLTDYQKMADACLKVTDASKPIYGWGMTANRSGDGDTTVRNAVFMWGGQINDDSGEVVVFNKDPYRQYSIDGLTWLKSVYQDPKYAAMLPPGVAGWGDTSNNEAWLAGQLAFSNNAGTMYATAVVNKNPVADDTIMLPQVKGLGNGGRVLQGPGAPMNFFVMKGAKNKDAALQIVQSLMTAETYSKMFGISTGYVYPAREWGWDQPELTEAQYAKGITPIWKQIFNDPSAYQGTSHPAPPTPQSNALDNTNFWTDMFGEILAGKAVDATIADWHNRVVQTYKEFGAKGE
jgi:multiple sugar transport system substrate-binding protein